MTGLLEDVLNLGYLGVFIFSLILNLVPFLSPSNLVISGAIGIIFPTYNPLFVGFLIAIGASIAKTVHFVISFFAGGFLMRRRKTKINDQKRKRTYYRFGMIATFIAAISPVPDDPIVIPLGLMRFNPLKFFAAYFLGKIIVTVTGAYLGQAFGLTIEQYFGQTATIVISVILTILVTIILIKRETILNRIKTRWPLLDRYI